VPPLNLESRMEYLIQYPYGCVEQTTSSAFSQLYLPALVQLDDFRKRRIEVNVRAGIERLREFQLSDGGFAYWPGGWTYLYGGVDPRYSWATTYVGHFLLEADKLGYRVPPTMLGSWVRYQRSAAQSWSFAATANPLDQAYRLYTLALSANADIGAMNRLREAPVLPSAARWMLAASYKLAGLSDAAEALLKGDRLQLTDYTHPDDTFGSRLRDTAIVLNAAIVLGRSDTKSLVDAVSSELGSMGWYSTQSVAYSLLAISKFVGASQIGPYAFEQTVGGILEKFNTSMPLHRNELKAFPDAGGEIAIKNTSTRTLFASAIVRGVPRAGNDKAANSVFEIKNIALTQMLPAGWEIHNDRMDGIAPAGERSEPREELWYWRYTRNARKAEYVDIRDDRLYSYFALNPGESIDFITHINAAYVGRYYLPSVSVEAMYDATKYARSQGQWVEVAGRK